MKLRFLLKFQQLDFDNFKIQLLTFLKQQNHFSKRMLIQLEKSI